MTLATLQLADTFGRSAAGLVYGEVSLQVDDSHFPDPKWTDFVVVVLTWWCAALARILRGGSTPIEVRFMEGPYLAELGPVDGTMLHLVLVEAGLKRRTSGRFVVEIGPLVESVLSAADRTLNECRKRDWWSRDADELAGAMKQLQQDVSTGLN